MESRLIERECGGWLAVTAPGNSPKIGVTAASPGEAKAAFAKADHAWRRLLIEASRRSVGDGVKPAEH